MRPREHFVIDVELADRIISSMLMNGDWNPDVIVIAAQTAQRSGMSVDTALIVDAIEQGGHTVNPDWTVEWAE